jgi:hypothetical protein
VREFLRLLFAPCSDISLLASTHLDAPSTRLQRFAVGFHCLYCKACRRYRKSIAKLREAVREMIADALADDDAAAPTLPADARQRILRTLDER